MILIAEPVHFEDTHLRVNTAMVALLGDIFKDEKILLFAEIKQAQNICKDNTNIGAITYSKYSKEGHFYWFQKIIGEWKQIFKVLKIARKEQPKLIVWLSLFPTGHLLQSLLSLLFFRLQKQLIILHSELEYLAHKDQKKSASFLGYCLKMGLKIATNDTHYLAIGTHIPLPKMCVSTNFHTIIHPFLFTDTKPKKSLSSPINICLLGTIQSSKNAHLFYQLASQFSQEIKQQKISFNAVGKLFDDMKLYKNEWVNELGGNQFIPQNQYLNLLARQDVVLFFYDETMYQRSASGAMMEAINLGLPIISLTNNCFDALNENSLIGKSIATIEMMKLEIKNMLQNPSAWFASYETGNIMFLQQNSFSLQSDRLEAIITSFCSQ